MPIPVSRDRLSRPVDISALLNGATHRVNLIVDEPGLQRVGLSGYGFRNRSGNGGGRGGGSVGNAVRVQRPGLQRAVVGGRDTRLSGNSETRRGGGRGRRNQLPSWYPRTPLRDITGIMRAIERRREELGLNRDSETPQEENNASNQQLDPEFVASTPIPTITVKPQVSPATQLLRMKIGNGGWTVDGSDSLTPQKKLLNSIEKVREVWLEDQRKLERSPAAKRAEREKKVRVLMSIR
ncbi:protein POLYCHOME-like [Silene latifolia]|uniref:protein POLYCHOME-like n=1 Tax=Silene latifolia TaxID=37657 RepID=UPI003D784C7C